MHKVNPLIGNINFQGKKAKPKEQSFGNNCVQNYAPMPVYTQVPYGIHQRNYVKLGVDKLPNGQEIHIYRLSNGQKVQIIKKEGGTSLLTKVEVGAFDEKGYPKGIAHFIEHSVFHGAQEHNSDLMKELDKITTFNNASTSSKETKYYMDLADDSIQTLAQALDIQSDMLLRPTFSEIEKEKPIVQSEYQKDMLDDFNLMYEHLLKNLFQYSDTNEASICGNNETIGSITKDDMHRFHGNFYKPSNMTTMITSKYNPDEIIGLVADNFISKSPKDSTPTKREPVKLLDKTTRTDIITNNWSDGNVFVSFVCPNLQNNFEILKLESLCSIFNTRYLGGKMHLNMQNSSIGLVSCSNFLNDDIKPNEAIQELYDRIADFKSKPPSSEEVKNIKKGLLKSLDAAFNSGNITVMENIMDVMNDNGNYITYAAYKQMIESLTPQNIYEMVMHFDLNKAAIVVAHSKNLTSEEIAQIDKEYPYSQTPIDIAGNSLRVNYSFTEHLNQSTGDKFYLTTLQDGSKLFLINSADDNCEIDWRLSSENAYSSNPASKFVLDFLYTQKMFGEAQYTAQDEIVNCGTCELKEIDEEIARIKSFSHVSLTKKNLEDAKKEAIKTIDEMESSAFEQFSQSIFGTKYTTSKEYLKAQVEQLTLNDIVNDLNNMILNSQSSYVVKAPILKNPSLAQDIANMLNTPNLNFKQQSQNGILEANPTFADCVISVDNANQNKIAQGYNFKISSNPKDYYIFSILAKILAGKNHNTIREKMGLAYYSGASFMQKANQGMIMLNTEASCNNNGDLEKLFSQYQSNVNELLNGEISADELLLAKNKMKGYIKSCFNDKGDSMYDYLHNFAFNPYLIDSCRYADDIIESITIDDIKNAANYAFKNKPQKIIIAKQSLLDENEQYINALGSVEKR